MNQKLYRDPFHEFLARASRADPTRFVLSIVENDFLPFAIGSDANVESQASWADDPNLTNGFQSGVAPSPGFNKAWRQPSFMAAALAALNVLTTNLPQLDNGDIDTMVANIWQSVIQVGYFPDVGSSNAYLTANPSGLDFPAPTLGIAVDLLVANTNTGASTLNWMGNGNAPIVNSQGLGLTGGELIGGRLTQLIFDGTNWQLVGRTGAPPALSQYFNIRGSAPGGTKGATFTADQLTSVTGLAGAGYPGVGLSLTFNGAGTGAGGMDTGTTPTSAAFAIYAIFSPTAGWNTLGTVGEVSSTFPWVYGGGTQTHMPTGYIASVKLWSGYTDGSGNILPFAQMDYDIGIGPVAVLNNGTSTATSPAAMVPLSSCVPIDAKRVTGYFTSAFGGQYEMAVGPVNTVNIAYTATSIGQVANSSLENGVSCPYRKMMLLTPQEIFYVMGTSTPDESGTIVVSEYSLR